MICLCIRITSTLHPISRSKNDFSPETRWIFGGMSTQTSTSLPSCCSPLDVEPNSRKEVTPNRDFKCFVFSVRMLMHSSVDFINFCLTACKNKHKLSMCQANHEVFIHRMIFTHPMAFLGNAAARRAGARSSLPVTCRGLMPPCSVFALLWRQVSAPSFSGTLSAPRRRPCRLGRC